MMKRFLLPMVFFLLALAAGAQTPVQFPITAMVGQSGYSGTMTLTPTATLLFGPGGFQVGTPARVNIYGTNPVVYLQPNTYKVGFSGTAATFYIVVPASTNTLNATNLLTLQPIYALANGVVTTNGATAAGQVPVLSPGSTGGIAWQAQSGGGGGSANLSNGVASYLTTNPVSGAVSVNVATNTFDLAGSANQVGANGTNLVNTVSNTVLNLATNFASGSANQVGANGTNLVNTVSNTVLNLATNFAAGVAQKATNGLGGAAYVPTNTFDLAGAANAATNTL